ncbi:MAG TPA: DedA family protein, partial [Chloroflexota bacterium]|nr:DedA family protein [Chloroflexota bacterium]
EHDALLLFLSVLVEEGGVPLPVPSDVAVLVAAHRAARGEMSLLTVFLLVQAATLIGASGLYWAGRWAGRPLLYRYGTLLHLGPQRLAKVERLVKERGALAVIVGRLVPGLRIVTPLACGVFRVPYRQFLPALAVASSVYLAVVIAVGVVGGPALLEALDSGILPVRFLVTTLLLGGTVFFLERLSRRVRARLTPGHRQAVGGRPSFEAALLAGLGASAVTGLAVSWLLALLALLGLPAAERALLEALQRGGQTFPLHAIFPSPMLPPGLSIPGWPEGLGALLPLLVVAQLLWAVLYAAVAEPRLRGSAGVRGLQFALVPWLTSGLLYLPLIGAGSFGLALGAGWLPILGEAVRCAIFGISLGVLYRLVRLARQPRKHSGWRRGLRRRGERTPVPAPSGAPSRAQAQTRPEPA